MESITGAIQGLRGATADTIYDLFFTEKRVVAAIVLHHSDLNAAYRKPYPLTFLVGHIFEQREIKMQSSKLMAERRLSFKNKTIDEILVLHKMNIAIPFENIASVMIKKGLVTTSLKIVMQGDSKKMTSFSLKKSQIAEVEEIINRALPNKEK